MYFNYIDINLILTQNHSRSQEKIDLPKKIIGDFNIKTKKSPPKLMKVI